MPAAAPAHPRLECADCPRVHLALRLVPREMLGRRCFECPDGFRPSRFQALMAVPPAVRPKVHSCRRLI